MIKKMRADRFSIIGLLTIVFIIAVGVAGWYVQHSSHKGPPDSGGKAIAQAKQNDPTTTADPSEGGKYLVIKEWGVRFLLSADLRGDVEYGIRKNVLLNDYAPDDTPPIYGDVAYFASKKLEAIAASPNNCGIKSGAHDDLNQQDDPHSYDGGPGVSLARAAEQIKEQDLRVGSSWFELGEGSSATCYEGSDGTKEEAFIQSVLASLKTVQVIPQD